jgi:hypothetical protein
MHLCLSLFFLSPSKKKKKREEITFGDVDEIANFKKKT